MRRIPPLLRFVVAWVFATVVALPVRLLIIRDEGLVEQVLGASMFALAMAPGAFGGAPWLPTAPDEKAMRRAVRDGVPPDDDRLRAALPARLAWLRRGARYGLLAGLVWLVLLAAVGTRDPDRTLWVATFALIGLVLTVLAARTLARVRRLARQRPNRP
ncbi:hypothetical protein [Micromonospora siamensis]|uniref:Transmembrane protein n=1 Tax=Micromonospora siamensis TaxID=299152 RepID=A0A1C5HR47_9ACTN|nr:hypothetical protein [Micromonospora siamensis]SCG48506.1 hypothetical protein GA0074704_2193 [Micromonospora siamensis]